MLGDMVRRSSSPLRHHRSRTTAILVGLLFVLPCGPAPSLLRAASAPPPAWPPETFAPRHQQLLPAGPEARAAREAAPADAPLTDWRDPAVNLDHVLADVSPGYDVVQSVMHVHEGAAFKLAHPEFATQTLELAPDFQPEAGTHLFFESRLGWATPQQTARVRLSADGGATWQSVWSRSGDGTAGETGFTLQAVDLSAFAGGTIRIRFSYEVAGSAFPQTDPGVGWYIDDIQIGPSFETRPYVIGDPTDEEQLFLEFINRARADAMAEALRLRDTEDPDVLGAMQAFQVDVGLMEQQFATLAASAQPLAFNPALIAAARLHSEDMFENVFQGHVSSSNPPSPNQPGDRPGDRAARQGYRFSRVAENVFAFARSVWHGHAGFNIDWGTGQDGSIGGMQNPPGHRLAIHDPDFREIGVGVREGTRTSGSTTVGPLLVTQKFATPLGGGQPLITGIAWEDRGQTGFYTPGDGIGGVTVRVDGLSWHAVTTASGGYAIPVPGDGEYVVTFEGAGFGPETQTISVSGGLNTKLDFHPATPAPAIESVDFDAPANRIIVRVRAPGGVAPALDHSLDLKAWQPLAGVGAEALGGDLWAFEIPAGEPKQFFRARTPGD